MSRAANWKLHILRWMQIGNGKSRSTFDAIDRINWRKEKNRIQVEWQKSEEKKISMAFISAILDFLVFSFLYCSTACWKRFAIQYRQSISQGARQRSCLFGRNRWLGACVCLFPYHCMSWSTRLRVCGSLLVWYGICVWIYRWVGLSVWVHKCWLCWIE